MTEIGQSSARPPPGRYETPSALAFPGLCGGPRDHRLVPVGGRILVRSRWPPPRRAFADFRNPRLSPQPSSRRFWRGWAPRWSKTLQIAIAGAVIGVILSLSRGPAGGARSGRRTLDQPGHAHDPGFHPGRAGNIAWALIFVVAVGLGPFAGMLAIVVDTVGGSAAASSPMTWKPPKRVAAEKPDRHRRAQDRTWWSAPPFPPPHRPSVSTSLYGLEKAVRSSTILGPGRRRRDRDRTQGRVRPVRTIPPP